MFLLVHSALDTRTREIRQSRDMTRMSPLKGNAILIFRVLFYRTGCICVKVAASIASQFHCVSILRGVYSIDFSRYIAEAIKARSFSKMETYGEASG